MAILVGPQVFGIDFGESSSRGGTKTYPGPFGVSDLNLPSLPLLVEG